MMHPPWPEDEIARRAAAALAPQLGADLSDLVRARLRPRRGRTKSLSAGVAVAAAGVLVNLASLAWQIYRDLRTDGQVPTPQLMHHRLEVHLTENEALVAPDMRRLLVDAVVREVFAYDRDGRQVALDGSSGLDVEG